MHQIQCYITLRTRHIITGLLVHLHNQTSRSILRRLLWRYLNKHTQTPRHPWVFFVTHDRIPVSVTSSYADKLFIKSFITGEFYVICCWNIYQLLMKFQAILQWMSAWVMLCSKAIEENPFDILFEIFIDKCSLSLEWICEQ